MALPYDHKRTRPATIVKQNNQDIHVDAAPLATAHPPTISSPRGPIGCSVHDGSPLSRGRTAGGRAVHVVALRPARAYHFKTSCPPTLPQAWAQILSTTRTRPADPGYLRRAWR